MTDEACSLVTGNTYQVTNAAKRVIDPRQTVTVKDGGSPVAASGYTFDYLHGRVTFVSPPGGAVTVTATYLPRIQFGCANSFDLNETRENLDRTCFQPDAAAGEAARRYMLGLKTASGTITQLDVDTAMYGSGGANTLREEIMELADVDDFWVLSIEFGNGKIWRGFVIFNEFSRSAGLDSVIETNLSWNLAPPDGTFGSFSEI